MKAVKKTITPTAVANITLGELSSQLSALSEAALATATSRRMYKLGGAVVPPWLAQKVVEMCRTCSVDLNDLMGDSRSPVLVHARRYIVWTLRNYRIGDHPIPSYPVLNAAIRARGGTHSSAITMYQAADKDPKYRRPPKFNEYGKSAVPQEGEYAN